MDYICNECKLIKSESEFGVRHQDGQREKICKNCIGRKPYRSNERERLNYKKRRKKQKAQCDTETYKVCSKCNSKKHIFQFAAKGSVCKDCNNEYMRDWNSKNRAKVRAFQKVWRQKNKGICQNSQLKSMYGITLKEYNELLKEQNNVCAICGNGETAKQKGLKKKKNLAVDHCHSTNKVRGFLCSRCNTVLGSTNDSIEILEKMIEYLKRNK